jgi:hypothetical protein
MVHPAARRVDDAMRARLEHPHLRRGRATAHHQTRSVAVAHRLGVDGREQLGSGVARQAFEHDTSFDSDSRLAEAGTARTRRAV